MTTARKLINERGEITQFDVYHEIERMFRRKLTKREKIRVTETLRVSYLLVKKTWEKVDGKTRRVFYFGRG